MKKLLIAFMFVMFGLFASANTKEVKKMNLSKSHIKKLKSPDSLSLVYSCANGTTITVCCFSTYLDAAFYKAFTPNPCGS
jgi:hypothetical protein